MARKPSPAQLKAKRDKVLAGVLGGLLLIMLVVAVPMTMKQMKKLNGDANAESSATPATPTTPTAPPATPLTPPPLPGSTAPSGPGTDLGALAVSQLVAFDRFDTKDPFKQQVEITGADTSGGSVPLPPGSDGQGEGEGPATFTGPSPPPPSSPPAQPTPTSAVISVNGGPNELLVPGTEFPVATTEPIFKLVSVGPNSVKISIAGGSFESGVPTVTVKKGKPLTLVNTADGTEYEVRLLWVGSGAPPPGLVTSTTSVPTSPPSPPAPPPPSGG